MKKLFLLIGLIGICSNVRAEESRPQFRTWRSSQIGQGNYTNTFLSSSPIMFHMLSGSGTVNNGGNNYFVLLFSSANPIGSDVSTKAFVPLNSGSLENSGIGYPWDTPVTSTSPIGAINIFYSKQGGGGPLFILYDTYKYPPISGGYQDKFFKD